MTVPGWPTGKRAAASFTFDVDAESPWLAMDPENANRPGLLSLARYGPRVGVPLILPSNACWKRLRTPPSRVDVKIKSRPSGVHTG